MSETTSEAANTGNPLLEEALASQQRLLLDIGKRNPLTNSPLRSNRRNQLLIVDELSDEIFRILYVEGKKFTFLASSEPKVEEADETLEDVDDTYVPPELEASVNAAHVDTKLQTELTPSMLQQRLLYLHREAKSIEEEQGVSVLFLALGFLRYYENEASEIPRYGPLILLPVELSRDSRRGVFRLSKRDFDLESNKSMAMMLQEDFQLVLPDFQDDDSWTPSAYFDEVEAAVASKPRWAVERNRMSLSFFSFAKFLMYRDLEIGSLDSDSEHAAGVELVGQLLTGTQSSNQDSSSVSITAPERSESLDSKFSNPRDLGHILDADSSQALVIAASAEGKNIVVQGPPGTGKSQTIANIIATAVSAGKRVLFIAEKRAALEVVMKRLVQCGLGPLCLELHSHKANRSEVYASLKATWDLDRPVEVAQAEYAKLQDLRDRLNRVTELVHTRDSKTGNTAFRLMGRISRLSGAKTPIAGFDVPGIDSWTIEQFNERRNMVRRFAQATIEHGSEYEHTWRGVENRLSPIDKQRLQVFLDKTPKLFNDLEELFKTSTAALSLDWVLTDRSVDRLGQQLSSVLAMPANVPRLLESAVVVDHWKALLALCDLLREVQLAEQELEATVSPQAFEMEWELHLNALTREGSSLWRFFSGSYRSALKNLKSISKVKLPSKLPQRIELLEGLARIGRVRREIDDQESLAREFFGVEWKRFGTSYASAHAALAWIDHQVEELGALTDVQQQVSDLDDALDLDPLKSQLANAGDSWRNSWRDIVELTGLDCLKAFGRQDLSDLEIHQLVERMSLWTQQFDQLAGYHELLSAGENLNKNGLEEVRNQISSGGLPGETAEDTVTLLRSERVLKNILQEHPELEKLSETNRTAMVEEFKSLDEQLRVLAAREVMLKHYQAIPRGTAGMAGVVRGELAKKRRHMPIRKLLDTAGDVVATLKPVFLMSPLSVAQYLKPDGLSFDLLLIDEASQVKPAEALGAVLRAKQVVVVGDQKQMPPTSFFDRQISGDETEEFGDGEETDSQLQTDMQLLQQSSDMESILALCDVRFGNRAMLSWHYRSEHPSLIEVSNHEFYSGKLTYPPSPEFGTTISGMNFVHVKDGVYDRGRRRHNEREAAEICDAVVRHVHDHPDWTLGVVALSMSQRNLIQARMEERCREDPEVEAFCSEGHDEPFFVKNLENVQGDERDVIFVSIGYGRDKDGYFGQGFGPVSQEGGERRLNVLFTRSRKRCVVFASITHGDIRVDTSKYAGPRVLKLFMKYAETGELDIPMETGEDMDSPFEEDVKSVLEAHNYTVHPQVGASGFKIDLAIVDPKASNHYLLAIECDGARYHSSSWARERDRLRQQVLERKGWRFHRIWSTDWFYKRDNEIQKLIRAVEEAREYYISQRSNDSNPTANRPNAQSSQTGDNTNEEAAKSSPATSSYNIVRSPPDSLVERAPDDNEIAPTIPYRETTIDKTRVPKLEIHELEASALVPFVSHVVEVEGPTQLDVIASRVAEFWGYARVGSRIRNAIAHATREALARGKIAQSSIDGAEFYVSEDNALGGKIRDRTSVGLAKVKNPKFIPSSEIRTTILLSVQQNISLSIDECVREAQKLLGTTSGRTTMRERIDQVANELHSSGEIKRTGDTLTYIG